MELHRNFEKPPQISTQRLWVLNGTPSQTDSDSQSLSCQISIVSLSDNSYPISPGHLTSWAGFLLHSSKQRFYFNVCGNTESIGMTQFPYPFTVIGYYFDKSTQVTSFELHGFSDASEHAYAAVVYLRTIDQLGNIQVSLVTSKTKVAPIKCLTIHRLELCGAHLLAHLLHHVRQVLEIPLSHICAWIVLNWLDGSPRRFKTFVGNRVSTIMEFIPPDKWNHVSGLDNPADCASRGLFPSELLTIHSGGKLHPG